MILLLANIENIGQFLDSIGLEKPYLVALYGVPALSLVALIVFGLLPRALVASAFGMTGAAVFALSAGQLAFAARSEAFAAPPSEPPALLDADPLPPPPETGRRLPDIIYVVPDRYGSVEVLADAFDHDNRRFIDALRKRGFAVAEGAQANYLKTHYSLASSLNMQYLDPVLDMLEGTTRRLHPLYTLVEKNLVTDRLKRLGYRYVHVGSWWDPTSENAHADISVPYGVPYFGGEFGRRVLGTLWFTRLALRETLTADRCAALERQLSYLETAGGGERPTFVFAHVLAPHAPILKDANGNCLQRRIYPSLEPGGWESFKAAYSDYVSYLNGRLLEIFDRQRASNPNPLIFVLQADEGPFPKPFHETLARGEVMNWRKVGRGDLATKFGILNALYLGEPGETALAPDVPEDLTPVNNWRVILSRLEREDYPLLPNRHFIFPTEAEPYVSIDITGKLRAASASDDVD